LLNRSVPDPQTRPETSVYRLALPLAVRMLGAALVLVALLMVATTVLVVLADWPGGVLVVAFAGGVLGLGLLWWLLRRAAYVLRVDAAGYRVGVVRGAGVRRAPWTEVREAATTVRDDVPYLVLELTGNRRTTLPVSVIAGDPAALVGDLQARLQAGHGLRPWTGSQEPGSPDS
jgi:hypothetical protein